MVFKYVYATKILTVCKNDWFKIELLLLSKTIRIKIIYLIYVFKEDLALNKQQ